MKLWAPILTGINELLAHKLRSLLSMLGVIFGIASVISMVSIGAGAKQETLEQIRLMGVNIIRINRKTLTGDMALESQRNSPNGLTYGDVLAIKRLYKTAQRVVPVCRVFGDTQAGQKVISSNILGTVPDFRDISHQQIEVGRFLDLHDIEYGSRVCVIGSDIKKSAFPLENPLGRILKIGSQQFQIIGVMKERTLSEDSKKLAAEDTGQDIYIPLPVAMDEFKIYVEQALPADPTRFLQIFNNITRRPPLEERPITQIILEVSDETKTMDAARATRRIFEYRHKAIPDYEIVIPAELLRQSQRTQRTFNIVMGAIASISLIVGGIGIMNIMLATVTSRTREIGIRRCVGANRTDIIRQFLLECLVITSSGGLLGIALGIGLANLIAFYSHWRTIVSENAVLISLMVAMITGVVFGLYPAMRAASIDPMEALRAE